MIESVILWITAISGGNAMIAGALTLSVSGGFVLFAKSIPSILKSVIISQFTTSLILDNTEYRQRFKFIRLGEYIKAHMTERGSRSIMYDTLFDHDTGEDSDVITMGYGIHFFLYKKKLFWVSKETLDSSGSEMQKQQLKINTLGRSHDPLVNIIEDIAVQSKTSSLSFNEYSHDSWSKTGLIKPLKVDSLALNKETRDLLLNEMNYFINNKEEYGRLGLNYKLTMVLHGVPGNGKTSLIKAMASTFKMNICNISVNGVNDSSFKSAINSAPNNSIIAIEDFDSSGAFGSRSNLKTIDSGHMNASDKKDENFFSLLSLSGVLNALDGLQSIDGKIIILTTNQIEKIDAAVLRSGRVDAIIELPIINKEEIEKYFKRIYPELKLNKWPSLYACQITDIVFKSKSDGTKAKLLLEEKL